ncbi:MAG: efflux RND transporter permease subunit, partial [Gemmatimonadetes bacterium]|nr:efflux RND transporter permease subunit [Gemmatimonadota bacterium]
MIPPLTRFGVNKPVPARLFMWTLIVAGVWCGLTMRREFFPETNPDRVRIVLPFPGATPEEIEESMARKVEDAVADLEEVDEIESTLGEGIGSIVVKLREGVDLRTAMDEVRTAVDSLTDLPPEAERIVVQELRPTIPVIMMTLSGDAPEETLKQAMQEMVDELRTLPGMGTLVTSGTRRYELRVEVSETALLEQGLSLPQVADAINAWMDDIPGGAVRSATGNINVRTLGVEERAEAVRGIVLRATADGQALRVGDIAEVREYFVDDQVERRFNGLPAVSVTAFKNGDEDAIEIAQMVRAYAAGRQGKPFPQTALERTIHPGIEAAWELGSRSTRVLPGTIALHSDLARLIEGRLSLLTRNAIQGAVLIFMALLFFLSPRPAWWVMVGLFTALGGTLVAMTAIGVTLN